ncbi:hypothetical protein GXB85_11710 [Cellulomonas sp. APG4]|uniref:hypothetical protein n=1 Tax=Cellulomonas sp. APG4 TaxID=1538656 RepID=UPI00137AF458|nr:hypothetical protein [Cellulomonas sp. APG4]NCT91611.1 hypothetical protein [Cellulomonas sp. APG4]
MGRHAAPPPERPDVPRTSGSPGTADDDASSGTASSGPWDRVLLAVVVGLVVGAVAGWSAASWLVAGLSAAGGAAVTLVAAWVAGTVPGRGP